MTCLAPVCFCTTTLDSKHPSKTFCNTTFGTRPETRLARQAAAASAAAAAAVLDKFGHGGAAGAAFRKKFGNDKVTLKLIVSKALLMFTCCTCLVAQCRDGLMHLHRKLLWPRPPRPKPEPSAGDAPRHPRVRGCGRWPAPQAAPGSAKASEVWGVWLGEHEHGSLKKTQTQNRLSMFFFFWGGEVPFEATPKGKPAFLVSFEDTPNKDLRGNRGHWIYL